MIQECIDCCIISYMQTYGMVSQFLCFENSRAKFQSVCAKGTSCDRLYKLTQRPHSFLVFYLNLFFPFLYFFFFLLVRLIFSFSFYPLFLLLSSFSSCFHLNSFFCFNQILGQCWYFGSDHVWTLYTLSKTIWIHLELNNPAFC